MKLIVEAFRSNALRHAISSHLLEERREWSERWKEYVPLFANLNEIIEKSQAEDLDLEAFCPKAWRCATELYLPPQKFIYLSMSHFVSFRFSFPPFLLTLKVRQDIMPKINKSHIPLSLTQGFPLPPESPATCNNSILPFFWGLEPSLFGDLQTSQYSSLYWTADVYMMSPYSLKGEEGRLSIFRFPS